MLDPISAVGVAAATVQFIDFSTKLFVISKEVHDSAKGTSHEMVQLDEVYTDLKKISSQLAQSLAPSNTQPAGQQDLYRLAASCQRECDVFLGALKKLENKSGSKRSFESFRQALKIIWSQKTIAALERRLERYHKELTLALIAHLSNNQSSITRGLHSLIADNRRLELHQNRQVEKINELLVDFKQHHTQGLSRSELGNAAMKIPEAFYLASEMIRCQRFLQSLYFPQLRVRHSRIENAHARTFKWLFQQSRKDHDGNDHRQRFTRWLKSGDGIFWISGKPGAGKSTLMKWIADQRMTKRLLFQWANPDLNIDEKRDRGPHQELTRFAAFRNEDIAESPDDPPLLSPTQAEAPLADDDVVVSMYGQLNDKEKKEMTDRPPRLDDTISHDDTLQELYDEFPDTTRIVIATFYFWSAGTSIQKSQQGLFQSLLYELFSHAPDLMAKACPSRWSATELTNSVEPWSMTEIADTIRRAITMTQGTDKFCFFVDGIDEYSGDHSEIIRLLQDFARMPNVKLCLSSRPWNVFEDAFGGVSKKKFYLQELTRGDIKEYVRSKLRQHPAWKALAQPNNAQYKEIVAEVLERADGVFLWVFLVVNSLVEGLTNGDTMSLLQQRLRRIPSDLRDFFKYILDSLDPIYNAHVAHFFIAALDATEPLPLMMYSFFEDEFDNSFYAQELSMTALELYEIIPRHKQTERRLNGRCKGLLEVYRDPDGIDLFRYRVGFLHRTVRDFFMTDEMRREFESRIPEKLNTGLSMMKASIAMMKKTPRIGVNLGTNADFNYLVDIVMHNSRKAETLNGVPTTRLLEELSYVLGQLHYLDEYWGNVGGNLQDMFLALAIERGLLLYVSQQLQRPGLEHIRTKRFQLGETRQTALDCAMSYPPFPSSADYDVSEMVLFLLTNGCDPNDSSSGSSPFYKLVKSIPNEVDTASAQEAFALQSRIRLLKIFLTHGAELHRISVTERPVWVDCFLTMYGDLDVSKTMLAHYVEVLELFLSFGADSNVETKDFCYPCRGPCTPWRHFLATLYNGPQRKMRNFHQREYLARLSIMLLQHGADATLRVHTSKENDRTTCPSVRDVIEDVFGPGLSGRVLAALPVGLESMSCSFCDERAVKKAASVATASNATVSYWNPLSWLGYARS